MSLNFIRNICPEELDTALNNPSQTLFKFERPGADLKGHLYNWITYLDVKPPALSIAGVKDRGSYLKKAQVKVKFYVTIEFLVANYSKNDLDFFEEYSTCEFNQVYRDFVYTVYYWKPNPWNR